MSGIQLFERSRTAKVALVSERRPSLNQPTTLIRLVDKGFATCVARFQRSVLKDLAVV